MTTQQQWQQPGRPRRRMTSDIVDLPRLARGQKIRPYFLLAYVPRGWEVVELDGQIQMIPIPILQPMVDGNNGINAPGRGAEPDYDRWSNRVRRQMHGVVLDDPELVERYCFEQDVLPNKGAVKLTTHLLIGEFFEPGPDGHRLRCNREVTLRFYASLRGTHGVPLEPDPQTKRAIIAKAREREQAVQHLLVRPDVPQDLLKPRTDARKLADRLEAGLNARHMVDAEVAPPEDAAAPPDPDPTADADNGDDTPPKKTRARRGRKPPQE